MARSNERHIEEELRDPELSGYVSPTPFNEEYAADNFDQVRNGAGKLLPPRLCTESPAMPTLSANNMRCCSHLT
jgi:hypothetical protein